MTSGDNTNAARCRRRLAGHDNLCDHESRYGSFRAVAGDDAFTVVCDTCCHAVGSRQLARAAGSGETGLRNQRSTRHDLRRRRWRSNRQPGIPASAPRASPTPPTRAATAAIRTVPGLDKVVKLLSEHSYERRLRQLLTGNAVRLGDNQLPGLWAAQRHCADVLDVERCPKLYVTQEPVGSGLTIGTNEPVTLVSSGLVGSYTDDELTAVLGHEMGHVLADHVGLTTTLQLVQMILGGAIRAVPLAGVPLVALYLALLEWSRAAELTSDRASAIVTGEPLVVCQTLMRMAGGPVADLNLDAFLRQATEYAEEKDPFRATPGSSPRSRQPIPSRCDGCRN